ncbi:MAG: SigB/SigF/SigG family RNA polymerase sigma factor [Actinomycetes bacterium]
MTDPAVTTGVPPPRRDQATTSGTPRDRELDVGRLARLPGDAPERAALRDSVVEAHLPLVRHLARRYADRGEPLDDLVQVGTIGLLKAVDRFDPDRGHAFSSFAVPTVLGEIRRHFRDRGWMVRVPRRLQDLSRSLTEARAVLTQELGRAPTVDELAARTGADPEQVLEALDSAGAYATVPLDSEDDDGPQTWLAEDDEALEHVENREALRPLLEQLPARERRILALRFVRGMSQAQIAAEVGISQMHVSRLLARTLATLRAGLTDPEA